jgi:hypothetical protein
MYKKTFANNSAEDNRYALEDGIASGTTNAAVANSGMIGDSNQVMIRERIIG